MLKIVLDDIPAQLAWAAAKIGLPCFREDARAFGVERDGQLCAVVVYDCFSPYDCAIHVASDGSGHWATRQVLAYTFQYAFIHCGLLRLTALIASKNRAALKFNRHLGFQTEGLCRDALPDDNLYVLGMTRKECRFIPPEYRQ
jgi:RimJ/RimL family protein N-acetyltransferase